MRIFFLSLALAASAFAAQAQDASTDTRTTDFFSASGLSLQYNNVTSGRAATLTYHQPFGNRGWRAYVGLRYHIHRPKSDVASPNIYTKSFFARTGLEHLGLKAGLEKGFRVFKQHPTELYSFWDVQVSHGALQATPYETFNAASGSVVTVFGTPRGDVTYFENNFGLGLRSQVTDRFGYRLFGGVGVAFIDDNTSSGILGGSGPLQSWVWQLGYTFGLGVDLGLR